MHIIKGLWNNIEDIRVAFNWNVGTEDIQQLEKFFTNRTLFAVCELREFQYYHLVIYTFKAAYKGDIENTPKLYTSHGRSETGIFTWKQQNVEIKELIESPNLLGPLFLKHQNTINKLFNLDMRRSIEIIIF